MNNTAKWWKTLCCHQFDEFLVTTLSTSKTMLYVIAPSTPRIGLLLKMLNCCLGPYFNSIKDLRNTMDYRLLKLKPAKDSELWLAVTSPKWSNQMTKATSDSPVRLLSSQFQSSQFLPSSVASSQGVSHQTSHWQGWLVT